MSMADSKIELKRNLTKAQLKRKKILLQSLSENPEVVEYLQLEMLDKQGYLSYTQNINTDRIVGEYEGISKIVRDMISFREKRKGLEDEDEI